VLKHPLGLVAAGLLAAAPLCAQSAKGKTPAAPELPPLAESVTVAVTNVEVVVTDSKGRRVHGLTKDDFAVYEDGIPQPLTNFYAVTGGRTTLADGQEISLTPSETGAAKPAPAEIPAALKAKYVIYVDNLNIDPLHRNRMFRTLIDFLRKTIGPNAEGMILTFNRSVKIRQTFTSDVEELVQTLDDIERQSGGVPSTVSARKDAVQRINDAKSPSEALEIARETSQALDDDLRYTIDGFKQTLESMAGIEGRKILIYLSDGLPQTVGQELYDIIQTKFQTPSAMTAALDFDRTTEYASLVREANAQGVTIYPIDAAGLQISEGVSAEYGQMQVRPSTFVLQQNMQAPLETLAQETGGIAAVNTNDAVRELDEIAKDFSDFYSLGYRSTRGSVDRPHQLEVKVKKKGLRVRYRSSYMEKTIETRTAEAVTAALYYPRLENPLNIHVAFGDPKPYSDGNFLVPVKLSIPLGSLTLVPDGKDYRGRVFVYFVVLDSSGQQSDLQIRPLDIRVENSKYDLARTKDYGYDVQLIMIPGSQKLSVAVRDGVSGSVAYEQQSIFIKAPSERGSGGS
jgi:VWFA-related protein